MQPGSWVLQAVLFVVVVGVLIVLHELGHFALAKLVGVRVEVFSVGFGKRLFGRRVGETDYRVSLLPLGGYVRMSGDLDDRTGAPHEFDSRAPWEKLLIMGAGPAMNLALAVALLAATYVLGVQVPAYLTRPVVVEHVEKDSPAAAAGIRPGDLIRAVDGESVPTWESFHERILMSPGARVSVDLVRDGSPLRLTLTVASTAKHAVGHAGISPCVTVEVRRVDGGSPASEAGLAEGDVIEAIDGERTCSVEGLVGAVQASAGRPLLLTVRSDGSRKERTLAARWHEPPGRWLIGVAPEEVPELVTERHGPWRALVVSVERNVANSVLLVETLGKLLTGRLSARALSGPLELADVTERTASLGLVPLLQLMALISLNLGLLNLLPIPLLDGGRIAVLLVEAVRGREFSRRTREWILQAGFVMIVALMAVVLYFDLVKKLEN